MRGGPLLTVAAPRPAPRSAAMLLHSPAMAALCSPAGPRRAGPAAPGARRLPALRAAAHAVRPAAPLRRLAPARPHAPGPAVCLEYPIEAGRGAAPRWAGPRLGGIPDIEGLYSYRSYIYIFDCSKWHG